MEVWLVSKKMDQKRAFIDIWNRKDCWHRLKQPRPQNGLFLFREIVDYSLYYRYGTLVDQCSKLHDVLWLGFRQVDSHFLSKTLFEKV